MVKRHDAAMNPNGNALSTALTSVGFVFHLGLSPASAMVNLTQTALVALPLMGGSGDLEVHRGAAQGQPAGRIQRQRHQQGALHRGAARLRRGGALGVIDVTMAHDLAGISQGEDARWSLRCAR